MLKMLVEKRNTALHQEPFDLHFKQGKSKTTKKPYELPTLAVGDVLLVGKFKNRKATITGFSCDENNQPVAQTDKGVQKIFKPRMQSSCPRRNFRRATRIE